MTLGAKIKALRKARDMSLQDVATRAAMSKAHVWEIERGGVNPTIGTLCGIAVALDADAAELAALAAKDHMKTLKIDVRTQSFVRKPDAVR